MSRPRMFWCGCLCWAVIAIGSFAPPLGAQQTTDEATPATNAPAAQPPAAEPGATDTPRQPPPSAVELERAKAVEAIKGQQTAADQRQKELQQQRDGLRESLRLVGERGLEDKPPYELGRLDELRLRLEESVDREGASKTALAAATASAEQARADLEEKERLRRRAKEAIDKLGNSAKPESLAALAEAEQASKMSEATLALRQTQLANEKLGAEIQQLEVELLIEEIARVADQTEFSEDELNERLAELDKEELELQRQVAAAETNLQYAQERWSESRRELDETASPPQALVEEVEAWRLARRKRQEQLAVYNRRLERVATLRAAWNRRWQVHNSDVATADERQWITEAAAAVEALDRETVLANLQLDQLRKELNTVTERNKQSADAPPDVTAWMRQHKLHVTELMQLYESDLASIAANRALQERLLADLQGEQSSVSPRAWLAALSYRVVDVWRYEVTSLDDRPITVGKIITGLLLLVIGWIVSRLFSLWLERRLRRRMWVNADAAAAFRTLTFYVLVVTVTLIALRVVNVPLTVFTVIGGGLAIGVGLGSQNLVNNFISGLVLLAERPMKIGERVVYGGYDGIVEEVGFRCTKVRTMSGHLVTVPNALLLNEPVENIGRRPYIRRNTNITITYDTPREKIIEAVQIIRNILEEPGIREPIHPVIGFDPHPPRVFFNEFNADSLNIWVLYWHVPPDWWSFTEHAQRVNMRIFEEFERAGIEFAFPTRTLYLAGDQKRQLALHMLDSGTNGD